VRHPEINSVHINPVPRPSGLARIGAWCYDHRKAAIGIWLAALIVIFGAAGAIGAAYDATTAIPDSESADGFDVLEQYFAELGAGGASGTIVFRADQGIDDPAVTAGMEELFATVNAGFPDENGNSQYPGATVVSPYSENGESQIAQEGALAGQLAYAQVNLAADVDLTDSHSIKPAIVASAGALGTLTASVTSITEVGPLDGTTYEVLVTATLQDSQLHEAKESGAPLAFAEKVSPVVSPEYHVGVIKNAPHPNVGHLMVAFMASAEVQPAWLKYTGHTSAYVPGTAAYKFVQGKQVIYMKQDQADKVDKISRQIGKILGFD
jgi:hypothetical protein